VPFDLPGVSKGKPLNKLGQRALNQGEIFFDDVRIPSRYMLMSPDKPQVGEGAWDLRPCRRLARGAQNR
jgi:alkylation response protein AidB-like acyl-CoA dehydrogenase